MTPRPCYKLVLRPEPDCVPEISSLRMLLKALLRRYGMRCVSIEEVKTEADLADAEKTTAEGRP